MSRKIALEGVVSFEIGRADFSLVPNVIQPPQPTTSTHADSQIAHKSQHPREDHGTDRERQHKTTSRPSASGRLQARDSADAEERSGGVVAVSHLQVHRGPLPAFLLSLFFFVPGFC